MTLRDLYKTLRLDIEKTAVRIYQCFHDIEDETVVFDNVMYDTDIAPNDYLDCKIWWFTWHPMIEWLEVHLEDHINKKEE